jgi:hypothetical protein
MGYEAERVRGGKSQEKKRNQEREDRQETHLESVSCES